MSNDKEDPKVCANPGCGRPAEEGSPLCDSCSLEWSLFHREVRAEAQEATRHPSEVENRLAAS